MLKECVEVFQKKLSENNEIILDTYIPADGTYIIVDETGNIKSCTDIIKDKKTKQIDRSSEALKEIVLYDYNSILVSMNKPVDSKKVIHSNNYLSLAVKKESITTGKLTEDIIDEYYDVLSDPLQKKYCRSKETSAICKEFEGEEGKPDLKKIEWIRKWVKENIFRLSGIDFEQKNYLKIFFEADRDEYERENKRYLLPNIYNSNDYNIEVNNKIFGMPNDNLGMNAKKPFLSIKTRKNPSPYLLDRDEVINQKYFFDYLMNLVSEGKYHIYVDTDKNEIYGYKNGDSPEQMNSGYYMRIAKGKNEAEIQDQDNISDYRQNLKKSFEYKNILARQYDDRYKIYDNRLAVGTVIDEIYFSKWLSSNYNVDEGDMRINDENLKKNIFNSRKVIFDWVFKGIDHGMANILEKAGLTAVKNSLLNDYRESALRQFNMLFSFRDYFSEKGDSNMGEIISDIRNKVGMKVQAFEVVPIESDDEYFYCVGQLTKYLISQSKAKDSTHALLNPIINARNNKNLKDRLMRMYNKYNYQIKNSYKYTERLLAMVMGYEPEGKVDQEKLLLGYVCDNVLFKSKDGKGEYDYE